MKKLQKAKQLLTYRKMVINERNMQIQEIQENFALMKDSYENILKVTKWNKLKS